MSVLKFFFRVLRSQGRLLLFYFICFLLLAVTMSYLFEEDTEEEAWESVGLAVIDKDNTELSKDFAEYMRQGNIPFLVGERKEALENALYWQNADYILTIPDGFQDAADRGEIPVLPVKHIENSRQSVQMDLKVKGYLFLLNEYLENGNTVCEAVKKMRQARENAAETVVYNLASETTGGIPESSGGQYYQFIAYVLSSIVIVLLGNAFSVFEKEEIRIRSSCPSLSMIRQYMERMLAALLFAGGILVLAVALEIVVTEETWTFRTVWYAMNCGAFLLVCYSIAFLLGILMQNEIQITVIGNLISLAVCLLGGCFFPVSNLPAGVGGLLRLLPGYWYVAANKIISDASGTPDNLPEFFWDIGAESSFALAILCVALLFCRRRHTDSN